jgi:uncharacterized oligopeptide transporter (OPT) family protein
MCAVLVLALVAERFLVATSPPAEQTHQPFIPDDQNMPELTLAPILAGVVLGIVFGASSLYLVLKVGLTVSASIPIAVLSITLFRLVSKALRVRNTTILENNVVQTAGSAGESIAFGVGVTMPTLVLLGFEMELVRVMTVAILGGLLGILMMIPLRRAFIVKQHGVLPYPEGTACAEVLVAGEKGGATAKMVFLGFGVAFIHKALTRLVNLWSEEPSVSLHNSQGQGLKAGELGGELSPELLGVGYLIGPRIACTMVAGGVLSYLALVPLIATIGEQVPVPVSPAVSNIEEVKQKDPATGEEVVVERIDRGLIGNMEPSQIRRNYVIYIGAGAVATGGILSMLRALPLIVGSLAGGLRDLRSTGAAGRGGSAGPRRTERDLPLAVVLFGSIGMVATLAAVPALGLGLSLQGLLGGAMILLFGFLFVTVSSRLTGEIGSSSNPISGMTIATLLLTCLIFVLLGKTDYAAQLTALTVAAVVCIASSNGGTTSQDLKTGYLVGATPYKQQYAILIGALTSAAVIGLTLLALDQAGTIYTKNVPAAVVPNVTELSQGTQRVGRPYHEGDAADPTVYHIVHLRKDQVAGVPAGRYLVDDQGVIRYKTDPAINGELKKLDDGSDAPARFSPPQPRLFASIIDGILTGKLEWGLVLIGAMIAFALELARVPSLPFAVGMYIPLSASTPIFLGGLVRWLADRRGARPQSEAEAETTPGVLLASGLIAGGTLAGVLIAFTAFAPEWFAQFNLRELIYSDEPGRWPDLVALVVFLALAAFLLLAGRRRSTA